MFPIDAPWNFMQIILIFIIFGGTGWKFRFLDIFFIQVPFFFFRGAPGPIFYVFLIKIYIKTFKKYRKTIKKSKFSSRATKNYENKSDLHEISRRIDWERPRGGKIG